MQGEKSGERLIGAAKAVANGTAQLLVSCKVEKYGNTKYYFCKNREFFVLKSLCVFFFNDAGARLEREREHETFARRRQRSKARRREAGHKCSGRW